MKSYQYMTVVVGSDQVVKKLNELGADGWRLHTVLRPHKPEFPYKMLLEKGGQDD